MLVFVAAGGLGLAPLKAPANTTDALFEDFGPAALSPPELRLLQASLAATGDYRGTLDGRWTTDSDTALRSYADREFAAEALNLHAASAVISFLGDIRDRGWEQHHMPELGLSLALPELVLSEPLAEDNGRRWWSLSGSLTVLTHRFGTDMTASWHEAASMANTDTAALISLRQPDRLVTSGLLSDGRSFYTRSDRVQGHWATVYLASGPDEVDLLNLISSSIQAGQPAYWELPDGGLLDEFVRDTISLVEEPDPVLAWFSPSEDGLLPPEEGPDASGTGFFVSENIIITASHVTEGCAMLTLEDGTPLEVIARSRDLDVAALASPRRAAAWMTISAGNPTRLGQKVHAVGFPYYAIAGTSMHLTGGNVSSLADVNDDTRFFSFTAPVQPGNSGGPLLDADGGVLGLVVSRLSERYIADTTGTLPQNINYALGRQELRGFLDNNDLTSPQGGIARFGMDDGVPDGFGAAIVPVLCN